MPKSVCLNRFDLLSHFSFALHIFFYPILKEHSHVYLHIRRFTVGCICSSHRCPSLSQRDLCLKWFHCQRCAAKSQNWSLTGRSVIAHPVSWHRVGKHRSVFVFCRIIKNIGIKSTEISNTHVNWFHFLRRPDLLKSSLSLRGCIFLQAFCQRCSKHDCTRSERCCFIALALFVASHWRCVCFSLPTGKLSSRSGRRRSESRSLRRSRMMTLPLDTLLKTWTL